MWHGDRLPELRLVVDEQNETSVAQVRAIPIRYLDDREAVDVPLAELEGAGVVDLSSTAALKDGDFRIVVTALPKGGTLATASLRARSGSWPRPLEEGEDTEIGHVILHESCLSPFPTSIAATDPEATKVVGALIDDKLRPEPKKRARTTSPMPVRPGAFCWRTRKRMSGTYRSPCQGATPKICPSASSGPITTGSALSSTARSPFTASARIADARSGGSQNERAEQERDSPTTEPKSLAHDRHIAPASSDDLGGRQGRHGAGARCAVLRENRLMEIVARHHCTPINDAPWFAHDAARRLEALGHIQIEIDDKSVQPKRWRIAPSTIVMPELGPCFLAGARSARLIGAIAEASAVLEGEVLVIQQPDGPDVVEIHGLGAEELDLLVEAVNEENRLELALSIHPASRIAAMLPSLSTSRTLLPELTTTASRLEWLDLSSGRWIAADQMDRSGAYRLRSRPWVYAVVPKAGARERRSVVADVRLAKHIAASDASFALMGYDESSRTLIASAGAPLPGLLERAAALCSGRLPTLRPDRTLAYEQVPLEIAEAIWAASTIGD